MDKPEDSSQCCARVLLVIPCFRESGRLPRLLRSLRESFASNQNVMVRVIDDGSGPEEQEKLGALVEDERNRWPGLNAMVPLPNNLGKGGAIYEGWRNAGDADWLAFADADGSCSAREIHRLMSVLDSLPGSVAGLFASRIKMLGRKVERNLHRHLIGRIYATLVSNILNIEVYDSQCGLKFVRARAFEAVRQDLTLKRFAFDVDLLASLLNKGLEVREEPIDWHEVPGGKVHLVSDSLRMLRDVWSIRRKRQP